MASSQSSRLLWCVTVTLLVAGQITSAIAQEAQVWGIHSASNQIVRVDPLTGAVFAGFTPPGGALLDDQIFGGLTIAEKGKTLLYQNPVANPTDLFRIDPQTGATLRTQSMPAAGNPDFRAGLSFETGVGVAGTDAIFAVNDGAPIQRQDGFNDPTLEDHFSGLIAYAGALGGDDTGRQFVAVLDSIVEFSGSTPELLLNTLPAPTTDELGGMAFDGSRLYVSYLGGQLFTLDPDSGAVLNSVTVEGGPLIGLAARTIPEPSAIVLVAALGLTVAGKSRRPSRR